MRTGAPKPRATPRQPSRRRIATCPGDLSLCRRLVDRGVFARYLNITTVLVSQWGRGEKRPQGASSAGIRPHPARTLRMPANFKTPDNLVRNP